MPCAAPDEAARWLAPGCLAAAVLLGLALQAGNGFLHPTGLALLTASLALLAGVVAIPRATAWQARDRPLVRWLACGALLVNAGCLLAASPGLAIRADAGALAVFRAGTLGLLLLAAAAVLSSSAHRTRLIVPALVAVHTALGVWVIRHAPDPGIDVLLFQREAVAALIRGENPYALTFANVYDHAGFYGDGLSVDGRLQFGFPYLPLSLLAAVPGAAMGGDPRYSHLAAIELTALLMAVARPGGLGSIAAALHLTMPRLLFVLEQSWTEPFVVLGAAAVVVVACRVPGLVPWLFGACVAVKQYLVLAVPAAVLLVGPGAGAAGLARLLVRAAAVALLVTLPFVLWDPGAFVRSVVTLQIYQPFRGDALSYLAWWAGLGHPPPSAAIAFVAAALAAGLAVWRLPRSAAGFAAALALTYLAFFAFNKQAFANYYAFVIGALLLAVAAWQPPARPDSA